MNNSLITAIEAATIICFGISFFSLKWIRTKLYILSLSDDKDIKLLRVGSMFFGLGLLLLAFHFLFQIAY